MFLCVPSIPSVILDGLVFQFPGLVSKPLQLGQWFHVATERVALEWICELTEPANSEVVWSMCPTYPGQALWNTRFPAGVLPSPARYSFWVHIRKRPQRLEVGCGDRAWTWRKRQVFDWCVTLWLITNRSLPLRVLRLLCRQKLQMLSSISKVSSLWWLRIPLVVLILFSAQETWQPWQPSQP